MGLNVEEYRQNEARIEAISGGAIKLRPVEGSKLTPFRMTCAICRKSTFVSTQKFASHAKNPKCLRQYLNAKGIYVCPMGAMYCYPKSARRVSKCMTLAKKKESPMHCNGLRLGMRKLLKKALNCAPPSIRTDLLNKAKMCFHPDKLVKAFSAKRTDIFVDHLKKAFEYESDRDESENDMANSDENNSGSEQSYQRLSLPEASGPVTRRQRSVSVSCCPYVLWPLPVR